MRFDSWRDLCAFRAFLANSRIVWRMNNDFYLLAIYFFKYIFQQIFYPFCISFKYYFFILFLFFLYSFLTVIFFKFPTAIFFKFHNIFKFCSKREQEERIYIYCFQLFYFVGWLQWSHGAGIWEDNKKNPEKL